MASILNNSVFLHIPKCGGQWVRHVLRANGLEKHYEWKHRSLHFIEAQDNFGKSNRFCFVRHPGEWYKSYYRYVVPRNWKEIPEVPLSGLRRDSFQEFIEHVVYCVPGFLSWVYRRYAGPPEDAVEYVGRAENLQDDLIEALDRFGEPFDEAALRKTVPKNRSFLQIDTSCSAAAMQQLLDAEKEAMDRFGYS